VPDAFSATEDPRLHVGRKTVYGTGDFTVNTVLVSLNIVYVSYFLTQVAGLRPELAGLVQLIGRAVDAFTDPAMGRWSDRCAWKLGRRRPFFLIGAIPFGVSFAMLWAPVATESQLAMFGYYTAVYVALSLSMTVLSVPYLALQPEMAIGYDARTSLNMYRNVGSLVGVLMGAAALRPLAGVLGGGAQGFATAGILLGVMLALPWFAVYAFTWERPNFQTRAPQVTFREGLTILLANRNFRRLTGLYLCGRIALDLIGAMLILYFTFWIGRSGDFEITMILFVSAICLSLPAWMWFARRSEKRTIFQVGSLWWAISLVVILLAQPEWPRFILLTLVPISAIGYAMVDLMPWSMLGEVVDEDDLQTGERREGVYYGFFMFLRKLAGTVAVALAMALLGWLGFDRQSEQNDSVLMAIRLLTSVGPAVFLLFSVWISRGYGLSREAHAEILTRLEARGAAAP
jgi:sugar (glycoside-pentoside-hexuronide) transporter